MNHVVIDRRKVPKRKEIPVGDKEVVFVIAIWAEFIWSHSRQEI